MVDSYLTYIKDFAELGFSDKHKIKAILNDCFDEIHRHEVSFPNSIPELQQSYKTLMGTYKRTLIQKIKDKSKLFSEQEREIGNQNRSD